MAVMTTRAMREEAERAMDVAEQMMQAKLTRDEVRSVYALALDVWKTKVCTQWAATRRSQHTCSATTCRMQQLGVAYEVVRMREQSWAQSVRVTVVGEAEEHAGGDERALRTGEGTVIRGTVCDAFVCTSTALLHICNAVLCGGEGEARADDAHARPEIGSVCRVTGMTYGGADMVHKYWRPGAQSATSESTGLTRRDTINGLMAFSRHRRSCNYTFGESWTDFAERLQTLPLDKFDTNATMQKTVKECGPKRFTYQDARSEYKAWAIARVASLYSSARQKEDVLEVIRVRGVVAKKVRDVVRTTPMTVHDGRALQVNYMNKRRFPMSFMVSDDMKRMIIELYAHKCLAYWATVCMHTVVPSGRKTAADRANKLVFPDFVVACMYLFMDGMYLPPDVTRTHKGMWIIRPDHLLQWTLPEHRQMHTYTCSKDAVFTQRRNINKYIIEAVRDLGVDPMLLMPDSVKLRGVPIDILPELTRHRDRKKK